MLLTLAAIAVAAAPAPQSGVRVNARMSVRIISGARVELGRSAQTPDQRVRPSMIRLEDGAHQIAQLIEFN